MIKAFLFFLLFVIIIMIGKVGGKVNNKGQALIEFVLLLPVILFIMFGIIDFGIIFNEKNTLENNSLDIINLYNNGETIEEIKKLYKDKEITIKETENYYTITIIKKVKLITPGLGRIFGSPYNIKTERVVPYVK